MDDNKQKDIYRTIWINSIFEENRERRAGRTGNVHSCWLQQGGVCQVRSPGVCRTLNYGILLKRKSEKIKIYEGSTNLDIPP